MSELEFYEIVIGVLGILTIIGVFSQMFQSSPAEIEAELEEAQAKAKKSLEESTQNMLNSGKDSDERDLSLDAMIMLSLNPFGEMLETIQSEMDPLVSLCTVYMFLESLHPDSSDENTVLNEFSYEFFKANLSQEDFEYNFYDGEPGTGHFENPVFWGSGVHGRINRSLEELPDMETRANICAEFCGNLTASINDDSLLNSFATLARKHLNSSNFYVEEAEGTLAALEL